MDKAIYFFSNLLHGRQLETTGHNSEDKKTFGAESHWAARAGAAPRHPNIIPTTVDYSWPWLAILHHD